MVKKHKSSVRDRRLFGAAARKGSRQTDGRIEIDQNLVENAIRPTALGKKNWLFIGEAEAGEHNVILYFLVEYCRRRGLDPYAYLRDILTRLPSATNRQIADLTPEAWAREHQPALRQAA